MNIKNNNLLKILINNRDHILIVLVLASLTYLSNFDDKDISKTYMIWTITYVSFILISFIRRRNKINDTHTNINNNIKRK